MTRPSFRRLSLALLAAPLVLGLAACGQDNKATGGLSGEPIATVAAPAGKAWSEVIAKTPEGGYRMGNPEAAIKLVEYGSLTCSHCADFSEKGGVPLRDTFIASGRVSYEFRNFVRDAIDLTAAQLTRCGTPESYFALTEQVFADQPNIFTRAQGAGAALDAATKQPPEKRAMAVAEALGFIEFFAARGISRDQAQACLANAAEAEALAKRTEAAGVEYSIEGTPTFIVNGTKIEENTWEALKAKLETMGAR